MTSPRRGFMLRGTALVQRLDHFAGEIAERHPGRRVTREGLGRELLLAALEDRT